MRDGVRRPRFRTDNRLLDAAAQIYRMADKQERRPFVIYRHSSSLIGTPGFAKQKLSQLRLHAAFSPASYG